MNTNKQETNSSKESTSSSTGTVDELHLSEEAKKATEELNKDESTQVEEEDNTQSSAEPLSREDQLLQQLEAHKNEITRLNDMYLRKIAEFENMRKRTERERVQLFDAARIDSIKEFLPVFDDLTRSVDVADNFNVDEKFMEGIKLVHQKFSDVLARYNVERIDELNVPFNYDIHEALMKQKAQNDDTPSDTVIQILEPGYKLGEKVIRHAKVIVSE